MLTEQGALARRDRVEAVRADDRGERMPLGHEREEGPGATRAKHAACASF